MPDFTKGKWSYFPTKDKGIVSIIRLKADDKSLGILWGLTEENEANARLVVAAPELYDAVYDLLDYAYEALHWAGGENETRGHAPRILRDIQECQKLLARIDGKEDNHD